MTVLPPGLIALPDVAPIAEQHDRPRSRPAPPARPRAFRVAFVVLVLATVLAGASALRDRSGADSPPGDPAPVATDLAVAPAGG